MYLNFECILLSYISLLGMGKTWALLPSCPVHGRTGDTCRDGTQPRSKLTGLSLQDGILTFPGFGGVLCLVKLLRTRFVCFYPQLEYRGLLRPFI